VAPLSVRGWRRRLHRWQTAYATPNTRVGLPRAGPSISLVVPFCKAP